MNLMRVWGWTVIVVACVATVSPVVPALRGHKGDSFPLSWFPMFAGERPPVERPIYVVGVKPRGRTVKVDVSFWSVGGFNQGKHTLRTIVREKRGEEFCEQIARRIARRGRPEHARVVKIRIMTGRFDRTRFFTISDRAIQEEVIAQCEVDR